MKPTTFSIRGAVCFSTAPEETDRFENAFVICQNGRTVGVFPQLPAQFDGIPVRDVGEQLVIPGMNDLHLHAPQYAFHGMYMDLELLEWLNQVTFPEEAGTEIFPMPGRLILSLPKISKKAPPPVPAYLRLCMWKPLNF